MRAEIIFQKSLNVIASGLAMTAQRLPFLKSLVPVVGGGAGVQVAVPLTMTFVGTHSLSGQSVTIQPVDGFVNPAEGTVGEEFFWWFTSNASNRQIRAITVETNGVADVYPPGLGLVSIASGLVKIQGTPTQAGTYTMVIKGWRFTDITSPTNSSTAPYELVINVGGGVETTPYEDFVANFWSGDDLSDPLIVGELADPDGDGIQNMMEFVLGLDPTKANAMPGVFGVDPDDVSKIKYEFPLNELASSAQVVFEESPDMDGTWVEVDSSLVTRGTQSIVLSAPISGKKFYRLRVSL